MFPRIGVSAIAAIRPRILKSADMELAALSFSGSANRAQNQRMPEKPESSPGGPTFRAPEEEDPEEESVIEHADELEGAAADGTILRSSAYRDGEDELEVERVGDHPVKVPMQGSEMMRGVDDYGKNTEGECGPMEETCRERYKHNEERLKAKMDHGDCGM